MIWDAGDKLYRIPATINLIQVLFSQNFTIGNICVTPKFFSI